MLYVTRVFRVPSEGSVPSGTWYRACIVSLDCENRQHRHDDGGCMTAIRQLGTVIENAGQDSPWGPVKEIRDMELTPSLEQLQKLPDASLP